MSDSFAPRMEAAGSHGHPGTMLRRSLLLWSGIVAAAMIVCVAAARPLIELVGKRALAPNRADCEIVRAQGSKRAGVIAAAIQGATSGWENPFGNGELRMGNGE